jgi:hypothetical protein
MPRSLDLTGALLAPEHDRAGAVAEQHAGAAVVPSPECRENVSAPITRARFEARPLRINCRRPTAP